LPFSDVPYLCRDQAGAYNASISAACANLTSTLTTSVAPFDSSNGIDPYLKSLF